MALLGCSTEPEFTDTGQPGQIKVVVFLDGNRNQVKDTGESGLVERVGGSQEISCPAGDKDNVSISETDPTGEIVYANLDPGIYCVAYYGSKGVTTQLTQEIPVNSGQETVVVIGIAE